MSFALTLFYIVLSYLSPDDLFPELRPYRIMVWLGVLATATSLPTQASQGSLFRARQVHLMVGLMAAIVLSRLAHLWFGGALAALPEFLAAGIVLFLIIVNVNTLRRLRILATVFVLVSLYLLSRAVFDYHLGSLESRFLLHQRVVAETGNEAPNLIRIRSVGFLQDPNDFGQQLLTALPLLSLLWRRQRRLRNVLFVILPAAFLLYGIYLSHSRGALIGLLLLIVVTVRSRLLPKPHTIAVIAAAAVFVVGDISGPRRVSLQDSSAAGRLEAWGDGLAMFKASPFFGVGYNSFLEHAELTAHNSFVLCLAELGLFGYFFWIGLIVLTLMDLGRMIRVGDNTGVSSDLRRWAIVVRLCLYAFVASCWFLSRSYILTLYLLVGMGVTLVQMQRRDSGAFRPSENWIFRTVALELASVAAVYMMIRSRTL